ncbi:hypothetical protein P1D17_004340 [Acinetobacter baumannii]|uniref:hypothetical protein n=1 Tax=Acinetobacter calcoaceticus/baumannii complex TaxID=909768 RepID=UPI0006828F02|nr:MULTISPECIES: hypothetical protein [Acinetobacter calcoaceticus/baumannii complex]KAB1101798.1 hypothetical protein F6W73_02735 [Acinetobacter baumannii]MCV4240147.1 hypothetical protein [Acinetobacter baumannii]MDC4354297.1 hypothetical protein [Acinetobacter baumannii]MDF9673296.1 hypothetical protein [Acinetobacter baumannii]MDF9688080.1 hypothetical protein [Acinetobacter baumannii]
MEIYKIVSFCFIPFLIITALLTSKSITLGLVRATNSIYSLISIIGIVWGIFVIISLFGWWSILVLPIVWFFSLIVVANFLTKRDSRSGLTAGETLLMNQGILGFFTTCLLIFSLLPYSLKWLDII